jgi:AcrR family transcriptional regulator
MPVELEMLSPKQQLKRQQIVDAATEVLLDGGLAACSTREIARVGGMNQGLIYYYFSTIEEIIDAAMDDLFTSLTAGISHASQGQHDPAERFWNVLEDYLGVFDQHPGLSLLWFEYWLSVTRAGHAGKVERLQDGLIELLTELLADAGVTDARARAKVILAYVLGVLVRRSIHPESFDDLRPEIASLARLDGR